MFLNKCDEIIAKKLQNPYFFLERAKKLQIDLAKKLQWIFFAVPQKKLRTQKMKIPQCSVRLVWAEYKIKSFGFFFEKFLQVLCESFFCFSVC